MTTIQLLGREQAALDAKRRLSLPARWRSDIEQLSANQLVLTEHPDGFLLLMPLPKWQSFSQQFMGAGSGSQWLKRIILGSATPLELDSAKRLLLPQELCEAAAIEKQALMVGVGEYFEVWSPAEYAARRSQQRAQRLRDAASEQEAMQASLQDVRW